MNIFKITGKYLDQPLLVAKFQQKVPGILTIGGVCCIAHKLKHTEPENRKKSFIKYGTTMAITIASALAAPKIANKIFKTEAKKIVDIKKDNTKIIDEYIKGNKLDTNTTQILNKAKTKVLKYSEIKSLYKNPNSDEIFLNKLIPEPENITSKEIFSEIGRLSFLGLIPVAGGILGGILGDKLSGDTWKEKLPNKIKEGAYQYLANIFLCNVGAGIALGIMEKNGIKSKSNRALGMIGGIITTGILGGSVIANIIGNKIIDPIFGSKSTKGIYNERKPEALDIGLHVDDIATVAVMSGLKWIEPALPMMYAISGYRAGIGYRNSIKQTPEYK